MFLCIATYECHHSCFLIKLGLKAIPASIISPSTGSPRQLTAAAPKVSRTPLFRGTCGRCTRWKRRIVFRVPHLSTLYRGPDIIKTLILFIVICDWLCIDLSFIVLSREKGIIFWQTILKGNFPTNTFPFSSPSYPPLFNYIKKKNILPPYFKRCRDYL